MATTMCGVCGAIALRLRIDGTLFAHRHPQTSAQCDNRQPCASLDEFHVTERRRVIDRMVTDAARDLERAEAALVSAREQLAEAKRVQAEEGAK